MQRQRYDEIAEAQVLSIHTVRKYVHELYGLTNVQNARDFRAWAQDHPEALSDDPSLKVGVTKSRR